jgi:hypothetical protein
MTVQSEAQQLERPRRQRRKLALHTQLGEGIMLAFIVIGLVCLWANYKTAAVLSFIVAASYIPF